MNKFYVVSALLHAIVILSILGFSKDEELRFKEKNTMVVSVKNRRAVSNSTDISSAKETAKDEPQDEKEKASDSKEKNPPEEKKFVEEIEIKKVVKKEKVKNTGEKKRVKKAENNDKKSDTDKKRGQYNEFRDQNRFLQGEDGVFTAVSLDGIEYEILKEVDPSYPIKARKIGYNGMGVVKVRFLVDLDGSIKNIEFISGENRFGFREEVEKALKKWKFKPIIYKGKAIRVHFEKEFKFKRG